MPPKVKVTKEMICDAAFDIARSEGMAKLTVRAVAERLGCSTQPVLYSFSTAEEIKDAVYGKADAYHSAYIMPKGQSGMNPLLELGMNYIRFAVEEKQLFQLLFQTDKFRGLTLNALTGDSRLDEIIGIVAMSTGKTVEEAREMFLSLFITAHGCASLLAGNAMEYEEERIEQLLKNVMR